MVSIHTSSRGILWKLGGEDIDIYKYNYNNNSINIDYVIVELPDHKKHTDKKTFANSPFLVKLLEFFKNILYI